MLPSPVLTVNVNEVVSGPATMVQSTVLPGLPSRSPEQSAEHSELFRELQAGIETTLTDHQREVLVALTLNDVPIDVLSERLNTTRGALYKTLHDARKKLRAHIAEKGQGL